MELVGQPRDDVEELDDRPGPPVDEQDREGVVTRRTGVDEVDRLPVDRRAEVVELVEQCLLGPPVVAVTPVIDELAHVLDRHPVLPLRPFDLVGKASRRQPGP